MDADKRHETTKDFITNSTANGMSDVVVSIPLAVLIGIDGCLHTHYITL